MVDKDDRSCEFTISFTLDQMELLPDGSGFVVRGVTLGKSRQHRHTMPSAYRKRKKKNIRRLMTLGERKKWSEWW